MAIEWAGVPLLIHLLARCKPLLTGVSVIVGLIVLLLCGTVVLRMLPRGLFIVIIKAQVKAPFQSFQLTPP